MATMVRPRVFLDLMNGTEPVGRVVLELFSDKAPRACENFRALCSSSHIPNGTSKALSYKLSPLHRVIDEFMIQGGDITAGNGTGGQSIYGGDFEDENLEWREIDAEGLLCMANRGKDTNSSQFFITLASCPHLNAKHTIFGHVISGVPHLQTIAKVRVDKNDRPLTDILVAHCGELERRTKAKPTASVAAGTKQPHRSGHHKESLERGRKRTNRSVSSSRSESSRSRSASAESGSRDRRREHRRSRADDHQPASNASSPRSPPPSKKSRRRSDLDLDETRRGRTLTRSPSPSLGKVVERPDREDTRHKRRQSPSRGNDESGERLRRESRERDDERNRGRWGGEEGNRRFDGVKRERDRAWVGRYTGNRWDGGRHAQHGRDDERYGEGRKWDGEGRLGGHGERDWDWEQGGAVSANVGVKFKGRGSMKYREKW